MNAQNFSEAPSTIERVVALREDLFFATDPDQDILVTTIHDEIVHLTDWTWTNLDLSGTLASPIATTLNGINATLTPGFEVTFDLATIKSVVNR